MVRFCAALMFKLCAVLDQDPVQPDNFFEGERAFPGLKNSTAPSLRAVPRRTLAFDLKACPAVGPQEEACGASHDISAGGSPSSSYRIARLRLLKIGRESAALCRNVI